MCAVSMVQDHYTKQWPVQIPSTIPLSPYSQQITINGSTRAEFDELKRMVLVAQEIDRVTGQPDCEKQDLAVWLLEVEARVSAIEDMQAAGFTGKQQSECREGIMIAEHLSKEVQERLGALGMRIAAFNETVRSEELDEIGYDVALICRDFAQPAHRESAQHIVDTYLAMMGIDAND